MEHASIWTSFKNLTELFAFLGSLIAIAVFLYWWWYNQTMSWWLWQLTFWPPKTFANLVSGTPLVVTLRGIMLNVTLFPEVVEEVELVVRRLGDGREFEFEPYASMGPRGFMQGKEGKEGKEGKDGKEAWSNDMLELFRPMLVEARSNVTYHLLFVPVGKPERRMRELTEGNYEMRVEFRRAKGKPKRRTRYFKLEHEEVAGFADADVAIGKLGRDLPDRVER